MAKKATGALKNFTPSSDFVLGTFSLAGYIEMIATFINKVQQSPTPFIQTVDGISADTVKAIDRVNKNMAAHLTKIKTDAGNEQTTITALRSLIGQTYNVTHHAELGLQFIYKEAKSGVDVNNDKIKKYLSYIQSSFASLETSIKGIDLDSIHTNLETDIGDLESDIQDMQNAIPLADSEKLNLTTLTEAQAKAKLDQQIGALNDDASKLQTEITWETVGQVGIGIVGGLIAITNFWNPIGWAAAGATVGGEVALAADKASKQAQLDTDRQKIALEKEEEEILGPYYTVKQYEKQLNSLANGVDKIKTAVTNMNTFIDGALADIPGFVADLGDPDSLELDYEAVVGTPSDPGDLISLKNAIQSIMQFPADGSQTFDEIKWTTMAKQDQWNAILNDPNSPFYIEILKNAQASA